jgi:hypothetical protein
MANQRPNTASASSRISVVPCLGEEEPRCRSYSWRCTPAGYLIGLVWPAVWVVERSRANHHAEEDETAACNRGRDRGSRSGCPGRCRSGHGAGELPHVDEAQPTRPHQCGGVEHRQDHHCPRIDAGSGQSVPVSPPTTAPGASLGLMDSA